MQVGGEERREGGRQGKNVKEREICYASLTPLFYIPHLVTHRTATSAVPSVPPTRPLRALLPPAGRLGGKEDGAKVGGREEEREGGREEGRDTFHANPPTPPLPPSSLPPSLHACLWQVASILKARLGGLVPRVIDDQCIQMCSRKVANVSGDLRKAFQVGKEGGREGGRAGGREGGHKEEERQEEARPQLLIISLPFALLAIN